MHFISIQSIKPHPQTTQSSEKPPASSLPVSRSSTPTNLPSSTDTSCHDQDIFEREQFFEIKEPTKKVSFTLPNDHEPIRYSGKKINNKIKNRKILKEKCKNLISDLMRIDKKLSNSDSHDDATIKESLIVLKKVQDLTTKTCRNRSEGITFYSNITYEATQNIWRIEPSEIILLDLSENRSDRYLTHFLPSKLYFYCCKVLSKLDFLEKISKEEAQLLNNLLLNFCYFKDGSLNFKPLKPTECITFLNPGFSYRISKKAPAPHTLHEKLICNPSITAQTT